MPTCLPTGANSALQGTQYKAKYSWSGSPPAHEGLVHLALFLGADGKISQGLDGLLGLEQTAHASGAINLHSRFSFTYEIDLSKVPESVDKIVLALAVREGSLAMLDLSLLGTLNLSLSTPQGEDEVCVETQLTDTVFRATASCELYRKNGLWKIRSLSQNYGDGLSALTARYGLPAAESAQVTGKAAAPVSPVSHLGQGHVILPDPRFGIPDFHIDLTWSPIPAARQALSDDPQPAPSKGLFKSLLGRSKPPKHQDLDLCCLFELSDGYRGIVQSLGDHFGSLNVAPFMELMGDSRGTEAQHDSQAQAKETIRINGSKFSEIKRAIFYAMIFEGSADWERATGRIALKMPEQVPIGANLHGTGGRACSALMIENINGALVIHKCVSVFKTPYDLDRHFGWGLEWSTGTKN